MAKPPASRSSVQSSADTAFLCDAEETPDQTRQADQEEYDRDLETHVEFRKPRSSNYAHPNARAQCCAERLDLRKRAPLGRPFGFLALRGPDECVARRDSGS